jgi:5'-methylthioadenosine phosphorylase
VPEAEIAIIGGSGFYELLDDAVAHTIETPYGPPSGPVTVGTIAGCQVAFLARHGTSHSLPPHGIPYRANIWALHQIGVKRILAPCAAGSLAIGIHPGDFVVCDQFIDRTSGRADTFFDGPDIHHLSAADPYCPELRAVAVEALAIAKQKVHHEGTVVVVQGPRFSTRAESAWYRSAGWDVINMTQYPEVVLARELGMCYGAIALVTDYDTGVVGDDSVGAVTADTVFEVLRSMVDTVKSVINTAVALMPAVPSCGCGRRGA